jgi:hypothetical protein
MRILSLAPVPRAAQACSSEVCLVSVGVHGRKCTKTMTTAAAAAAAIAVDNGRVTKVCKRRSARNENIGHTGNAARGIATDCRPLQYIV